MPAGKNAFDGYVPSVPEGEKLDYGSNRCNELETLGVRAVCHSSYRHQRCTGGCSVHHTTVAVCSTSQRCKLTVTTCLAGVQAAGEAAFVLVAGGLGERLGYSGIKLALPSDTARGACFLQVCNHNSDAR
jgi:UDP-sugar pyrophosphorylase